jgi:hypothetical protein
VPPGQACAIDPQCGCGSGEKCDYPTPSAACVTAGTGESGSVCTANVDCLAGLTCVSSLCRPFCTAADIGSGCPGTSDTQCVQLYDDGVAVDQDSVCFSGCTPVPNNCAIGACTILNTAPGSDTIYSYCQEPGTGAAGAGCTSNIDCAAGTVCGSSSGVCEQFCRTASDCANLGLDCDTTNMGFTLNGIVYGICFD